MNIRTFSGGAILTASKPTLKNMQPARNRQALLSTRELVRKILFVVQTTVAADFSCIFQVDDKIHLKIAASTGLRKRQTVQLSLQMAGALAMESLVRCRQPLILSGARVTRSLRFWSSPYHAKISSGLILPLFRSNRLVGICCFFRRRSQRFRTRECTLAKAAAGLLASALDQWRAEMPKSFDFGLYAPAVEDRKSVFAYEHDTNYIVRYVSASVERALGYSPAEMIGRRAYEFSTGHPSYDVALRENESTFKDGKVRPPYVTWLRHKDGHSVAIEAFDVPEFRDGKVVGMRGFGRDITGWWETRQKLLRYSALLTALFEHSPLGIVVIDRRRRVKMCNAAFKRIFHYEPAEIIEKKLDDLVVPKEFRTEARLLTDRALAGETVRTTARRRRRDRSLVDVEIQAVPLIVEGEEIGAYITYQDLTEIKQAEASLRTLAGKLLSAQDEERRRFSRELHDTTAQALVGLTMTLAKLKKSAQRRLSMRSQKILEQSIQIAEQCAKEIRTFSYLLHPPLLDEAGLKAAIEWYVSGFAARSGIEIELEIGIEHLHLSREAELALFRIVQESLSNVHRHARSSSARVILRRSEKEAILQIRDYGIGFSRARRSPAILYGVGIAGMRERLEQLGGRLKIESDRGTTVQATLPLEATVC
ncbi:MAG: PAS domain S-box protein [Candidatus Acidiferrales bacterium]